MDHRERMLLGLPYLAAQDGLPEERFACCRRTAAYNAADPNDPALQAMLREIFGSVGERVRVKPPIYCDYGRHVHIGDRFFSNFNCTFLDVAEIRIGNDVLFGPNVAIYTAGHPVHPDTRARGYEYGAPVVIGDGVWIGGSVVVCPGVTIGARSVIGAGSVVTHDIPAGVIAAGNPCRVIRPITEQDAGRYFGGAYYPDPANADCAHAQEPPMVTPSDSAGMNADRVHAQEPPNALPHDGNGTPNADCAHAQEPPMPVALSDSAGMNADRAHAQEHPNALPHDGNGTPNADRAHAQEHPNALPHDGNGTPNTDCAHAQEPPMPVTPSDLVGMNADRVHAQKQPAGPKE